MPERKQNERDEANATLSNPLPDPPVLWMPEDLDAIEGTTSGTGMREKPKRGSREHNGY